ncbi:MAG: DUF4416 family protein [Spirochaetia bacterium]
MGEILPFTPEKLVVGILCSHFECVREIEKPLAEQFGPLDYRSEAIPFTFTDYYEQEMGSDLLRLFVSFEQLVAPDQLSSFKIRTNRLENEFLEAGKRKVNLDPGLLSLGKLILASTKDNAQRIPLANGIFGEITLIYRRKGYTALPWTYRDYQSEAYQRILIQIRSRYKQQLQAAGYL